jgi:hypothetical protein
LIRRAATRIAGEGAHCDLEEGPFNRVGFALCQHSFFVVIDSTREESEGSAQAARINDWNGTEPAFTGKVRFDAKCGRCPFQCARGDR